MTRHRTGAYYIFCERCSKGYSFEEAKLGKEIEKHLGHMIKITHALTHV